MVYDPEILGIEGQTPVTWHYSSIILIWPRAEAPLLVWAPQELQCALSQLTHLEHPCEHLIPGG